MHPTSSAHARGQILVLYTAVLLGLLAIVGLSADGGLLYLDHRRAQSAADQAALAGGFQKVKGGTNAQAVTDALARAASNGFNNDGVTNWVYVFVPPVLASDPTYGQYATQFAGLPNYVQVHIRVRSRTSLIHLFYSGITESQVDSVVKATPFGPMFPGDAIVGLSASDCKTIWFNGNMDVLVQNGNIRSLSSASSGSCASGVKDGSSGSVKTENGHTYIAGTWKGSPTDPPAVFAPPKDYSTVPTPVCSATVLSDPKVKNGDNITIGPGTYDKITQTGGNLTMKPGLYCIKNIFSQTGNNELIQNESPTDNGVMIYLMTPDANISFGGGAVIKLHGLHDSRFDPPVTDPPTPYDQSPCQNAGVYSAGNPSTCSTLLATTDGGSFDFRNFLIYADPANTYHNDQDMEGNAGSVFQGLIFAPNNSCKVGGTAGMTSGTQIIFHTQVICDQVQVAGSGQITITYNEKDNAIVEPDLLRVK